MSQRTDIERFRITWNGDQYRVSIPDYEGGEVVTAEQYDKVVSYLKEALRRIPDGNFCRAIEAKI